MDVDVAYLHSVKNLHKILDAIQNAGAPDAFGVDFLKDLGFTSSNDRSMIKLLKYLGMLDNSGKPQASYREFMDHTKAKEVLASRLREAYDDLFLADKDAHTRTSDKLTGWFKTKTGVGDAVAKKMATTFKSLASYADFSAVPSSKPALVKPDESSEKAETLLKVKEPRLSEDQKTERQVIEKPQRENLSLETQFGLTYRIEINLPDTTNVETYRAIFRAVREELLT
jgi:hypothetical protein